MICNHFAKDKSRWKVARAKSHFGAIKARHPNGWPFHHEESSSGPQNPFCFVTMSVLWIRVPCRRTLHFKNREEILSLSLYIYTKRERELSFKCFATRPQTLGTVPRKTYKKCITNLSLSTKACGSYVVTLLNRHVVYLSGVWQGFVVHNLNGQKKYLKKIHVSTMSPRWDRTRI